MTTRKDDARSRSRPQVARQSTQDSTEASDLWQPAPMASSLKRKRSTTKERAAGDLYNVDNNLVDSLRQDLVLVFIGLNPGLTTAATGHAYAHSSNLFWKLLAWGNITSICHKPSDTHALMDLYSIGNTNIVSRPTRSADGLSKQELEAGAVTLEKKIKHFNPEAVCIVGKGIWDTIYKVKTGKALKKETFHYGWQDEELWLGRTVGLDGKITSRGSRTFVATTTSGLAAGMSKQEKIDVWKPLGSWFQDRRGTLLKKVKVEDVIKTEDEIVDIGDEGVKIKAEVDDTI